MRILLRHGDILGLQDRQEIWDAIDAVGHVVVVLDWEKINKLNEKGLTSMQKWIVDSSQERNNAAS